MEFLKIGKILLETDRPLTFRQSHLLRGYVARMFGENDLVHNHELVDGTCKYRYPAIQYKIVGGMPLIVAVGEQAIEILRSIACEIRHVRVKREHIKIHKTRMNIYNTRFGIATRLHNYEFVTPWIGLNSKNYLNYKKSDLQGQNDLISRCLIGNILSMSKYLRYEVKEHLRISHDLQKESAILKGQKMVAFRGRFTVNFYLPDYIGIGKSCSRGYGCCMEPVTKIMATGGDRE